jgi:hypothetical protein
MIATVLGLTVGCAQTAPSHDIPVREEYISAGIQAGDTIDVTMIDGEEMTFEVVQVSPNVIVGPDGDIPISNIRSIVKRSWSQPGHPCGANEPVGCSIPDVVLVLSDEYSEQAEKFHPACVMHDFCYRHGHATYGDTRERCDELFLDDMMQACGRAGVLNLLNAKEYSICIIAARQTYEAVRRKGEPHFRTATSTNCEFRLE